MGSLRHIRDRRFAGALVAVAALFFTAVAVPCIACPGAMSGCARTAAAEVPQCHRSEAPRPSEQLSARCTGCGVAVPAPTIAASAAEHPAPLAFVRTQAPLEAARTRTHVPLAEALPSYSDPGVSSRTVVLLI